MIHAFLRRNRHHLQRRAVDSNHCVGLSGPGSQSSDGWLMDLTQRGRALCHNWARGDLSQHEASQSLQWTDLEIPAVAPNTRLQGRTTARSRRVTDLGKTQSVSDCSPIAWIVQAPSPRTARRRTCLGSLSRELGNSAAGACLELFALFRRIGSTKRGSSGHPSAGLSRALSRTVISQ